MQAEEALAEQEEALPKESDEYWLAKLQTDIEDAGELLVWGLPKLALLLAHPPILDYVIFAP